MLRFKIDENLPAESAALLVAAGHDALTVLDQQLGGRPDVELAVVCRREGRVLVTLDLDFCDIRAYPPAENPGIIVLRLERQDKQRVISALERLVPLLAHEPLAGNLWIVEESNVRIRS